MIDDQTDAGIKDIVSRISDDELVDVASELIRLPSVRGGGETPPAEWVAAFLGERGYRVELQEVRPGRHQTVAVLPGSGAGRTLMLNGHLDIDPLRADWQRDPWKPSVEGDLLYGAGARNMKGGVSAMICAAEAVRRSGRQLSGDIVIACVMGELEGGTGTAHLLETGVTADMAILPEPLGARNLVTAMPGVLELSLTTYGFSEHVNRRFLGDSEKPVDAIALMHRTLDVLGGLELDCERSEIYPDLPFTHVGSIIGGRGDNLDLRGTAYVSDRCSAILHVCYPPSMTPGQIETAFRSALEDLSRAIPELRWTLSGSAHPVFGCSLVSVEPWSVSPDAEVVQIVSECYTDATGGTPDNVGVVLPQCYTAGDTTHLQNAGIPSLYYGPISPMRSRADSDDCVSISEMHLVSEVLARSIVRVCA